jgi:selenocysteine-specific translation elongation factor
MNTIVSLPFDPALADFIGKKGSENSITFYNRKLGENVIVALMPSNVEEKFYALPQSMLIADQILVSTKEIDKLFGEVLIACALLNKRTIFTKDTDVSKILTGITLENLTFASESDLLETIVSFKHDDANANVRVDVDKAFAVKGVGTVVLGVVVKGTVKVHDTLYHNSGKTITVRSIQSQDADIKEAAKGTRVGLAIKGLDETEMQKGDVLSANHIKATRVLELSVKTSSFANEPIEVGKMYSMAIGFSYVLATVEKVDGSKVTVKLEKGIPVDVDDAFIMVRTISPRIFAAGKILKKD